MLLCIRDKTAESETQYTENQRNIPEILARAAGSESNFHGGEHVKKMQNVVAIHNEVTHLSGPWLFKDMREYSIQEIPPKTWAAGRQCWRVHGRRAR